MRYATAVQEREGQDRGGQDRGGSAAVRLMQRAWGLALVIFLLIPTTAGAQTPPPLGGSQTLLPISPTFEVDLCRKPHAPGTHEYRIESDGLERRFLLHVPAGYEGRERVPVVLDLHGSTSVPEQEIGMSGMPMLADREGFAVVAPEGLDGFWNVPVDPEKPDDVAFIADVLDQVGDLICIAETQVYATGFSGGGRMVSLLACTLPERFAAVAPVGGLRYPGSCKGAVPLVTFHGTADPINPYAGGGPAYWQTGVVQALRGWATRNACHAMAHGKPVTESVTQIVYAGCATEADVRLYRIDGMGHQWPGTSAPIDAERFGLPYDGLDATQLIWAFFAANGLD